VNDFASGIILSSRNNITCNKCRLRKWTIGPEIDLREHRYLLDYYPLSTQPVREPALYKPRKVITDPADNSSTNIRRHGNPPPRRSPRLAASFISRQVSDVAYWPEAPVRRTAGFLQLSNEQLKESGAATR